MQYISSRASRTGPAHKPILVVDYSETFDKADPDTAVQVRPQILPWVIRKIQWTSSASKLLATTCLKIGECSSLLQLKLQAIPIATTARRCWRGTSSHCCHLDFAWSDIHIYTQVGCPDTELDLQGKQQTLLCRGAAYIDGGLDQWPDQVLRDVHPPWCRVCSACMAPWPLKSLADNLERVQSSCLLLLFPDLSYREALNISGQQTLRNRRVELCRKFVLFLVKNVHFRHWLPPARQSLHGS